MPKKNKSDDSSSHSNDKISGSEHEINSKRIRESSADDSTELVKGPPRIMADNNTNIQSPLF